ncbi:hypothetical protein LCGC14_0263790 [marine sediment metagenome]|uniref:Uncharacterized protein n=1 Tax=marine sediment metagenome TaxID=412755 RepID=A0A0F9U0T5_9ZZZZ
MKYLLLTPADVDVIRTALKSSSCEDNDYICPMGRTDCYICNGVKQRDAALKYFDQLPWGEGKP